VAALVAEGRHVVTIDARGHGQSGKPHDPAAYGAAMVLDVMRLADQLDAQRYDLVGYSLGAIVSLAVAEHDRRVRRLVLGGIGGGLVKYGGLDSRALSKEELAEALETADPSSIQNPAAAAFRAFTDMTKADRNALAALARSSDQQRIAFDRISVPTLVLAGAADPLAAEPELLAQAIRGARLQVLSGDHLGVFRDPALISAIVEFLR
jgi:pimeloyl-ACP methyl ester carboxylesterase